MGEREIGFAPVTLPGTGADAETQFTLQRAEFDPYNRGRSVLVLQGIFDNGGLHLPTVRYWQLPSAAALAALLRQQYWDAGIDDLGKPVIDTQAFPRGTTTEPRPHAVDGETLSVDETPHYFRHGGRIYLLAPLRSAPENAPDAGIYELSGPAGIKRRCLFRAHLPMANSVYNDEVAHDVDFRARTVASAIGPLLPAGKICVPVGDGPRTLWDDEAYRPWLLGRRGWWSVGGIDPPAFARYLHNRGLTGLEQNRTYRKYVATRETAIAENAHFFAQRFARSADAARRLAALAIDWSNIDGSMIGSKDAATVALMDDAFEPQHALQAAVFAGDEAKVSALLGADPKEAAARAKSPLDEPLVSDTLEHPNLLRDLLARGFDPNETGASGRTPLMTAARLDLIEAARILLERGAEVNAGAGAAVADIYPESDDVTCQMMGEAPVSSDTPGRTALSYAAELASPEMVRLLLEAGADPRKGDESGNKPADYVPAKDQDRSTAIRKLLK